MDKMLENLPKCILIDSLSKMNEIDCTGRFDLTHIKSSEENLSFSSKSKPDLIVIDEQQLLSYDLEHSCNFIDKPDVNEIPLFVMVDNSNEATQLMWFKYGAQAILSVPLNIELLEAKFYNLVNTVANKTFNHELLEHTKVDVGSSDEKWLQKLVGIIENNMQEADFKVEVLVNKIGMSRTMLYCKLKALTGLSSSEFIRSIKLKRAVKYLEKGAYSIKQIRYATGFNTASYFTKCFKEQHGILPSEYLVRYKTAEMMNKDIWSAQLTRI